MHCRYTPKALTCLSHAVSSFDFLKGENWGSGHSGHSILIVLPYQEKKNQCKTCLGLIFLLKLSYMAPWPWSGAVSEQVRQEPTFYVVCPESLNVVLFIQMSVFIHILFCIFSGTPPSWNLQSHNLLDVPIAALHTCSTRWKNSQTLDRTYWQTCTNSRPYPPACPQCAPEHLHHWWTSPPTHSWFLRRKHNY